MHFDRVMSGFLKTAIFVTFDTLILPLCLSSKIYVVLIEQLNEQGGVCFAPAYPYLTAAI